MINILLIVLLAVIAGLIVWYLIREKKRGVTCVGCPYAKECAKRKSGCGCGCGGENKS